MCLHHVFIQCCAVRAVSLIERHVDFISDEGKRILLIVSSKYSIDHDLFED